MASCGTEPRPGEVYPPWRAGLRRWLGTGLGQVLPLLVILVLVGGVVHLALDRAAEISRRTRCAENLRRIADGCRAYAAAHATAWPDVFTEASVSWYDVGNTRTDRWDAVDRHALAATQSEISREASRHGDRNPESEISLPAAPPPAEPADNGLAVQSNAANLWMLIHWGLGPETFVCPATSHLVDQVDVASLRAVYAAYVAERRKAEAAIAKAAAEREAAEKAAADKAKTEVPRELTPADLFAPVLPKKPPGESPEAKAAPAEKPGESPAEKMPEDLAIGEIGTDETTAEKPLMPARTAEPVPVATGPRKPAGPAIPLPEPPRIPRDFRGEWFCSYSYQNVLGPFVLTAACESPAEVVVVADCSPLRRDFWSGPQEEPAKKKPRKGEDAAPQPPPDTRGMIQTRVRQGETDRQLAKGRKFVESEATAPWNAEVTAIAKPWELNSPNHAFQGQNVLYLDGHVEWTVHPYCGPKMDNIWLRRRTDVAREPIFDQIMNLREFNDATSYDGRATIGPGGKEGASKGGAAPAAGAPAPAPAPPKKKKAKDKEELPRISDSFLVP